MQVLILHSVSLSTIDVNDNVTSAICYIVVAKSDVQRGYLVLDPTSLIKPSKYEYETV